jgi:hypothetical protein
VNAPRNSKLAPPEPRAQRDLIKLEVIVARIDPFKQQLDFAPA